MKTLFCTFLASAFALAAPAEAAPLAPPPTLAPPVLSQDADDPLADILGEDEDDDESTVAEERRELERDADRKATTDKVELPPAKKKVIKTLQRKTFLKLGRFEAMPYVGLITNDPFIRRILFGANLGYHITEIFEFELQGSFSPNFGEGDYKPITAQIIGANQVSPEISRLGWHLTANFNYSPFYGKVATIGRSVIIFDIYGTFGAGVAGTEDDIELIQKAEDEKALSTQVQIHPAITFGGGARVAFNRTFALRFEVRSLSYINTIEGTQLELKNNLMLVLGASIFFGRRVE